MTGWLIGWLVGCAPVNAERHGATRVCRVNLLSFVPAVQLGCSRNSDPQVVRKQSTSQEGLNTVILQITQV